MKKTIMLVSLVSCILILIIHVIPSVQVSVVNDYVKANVDCGCEDAIDWEFPVICSILLFLYTIVLDNLPFLFFAHIIEYTAGLLGGCPGIP